jgi:hypothetical protein
MCGEIATVEDLLTRSRGWGSFGQVVDKLQKKGDWHDILLIAVVITVVCVGDVIRVEPALHAISWTSGLLPRFRGRQHKFLFHFNYHHHHVIRTISSCSDSICSRDRASFHAYSNAHRRNRHGQPSII